MAETAAKEKPARKKKMLGVAAQIEHMKSKGIKFEKCTEKEAADYLTDKCNYFKATSYRKLFPKHEGGENDGKYVDLDFAQLKALSSLDQLLREALLAMTLDLEYFQKVSLLRKLERHKDEDGYSVVSDFLASLSSDGRKYTESELKRSGRSPYSKELYAKHKDDMPAWALLELTSFGTLLDFMLFCGKRWNDRGLTNTHYDFKRVKSIRNSCAHGSCLINSFESGVTMSHSASMKVLSEAAKTGVPKNTRRRYMRNPAVQEIATVLVLYSKLVPDGESRNRTLGKLEYFFSSVDVARALLPEEGPGSTAITTLDFIKCLTENLGLLK